MAASSRSILAAAGPDWVSPQFVSPGDIGPENRSTLSDEIVSEIVRRSEQAHGALMRGDATRYRELITFSGDFLLMSPFGGKPTCASEFTAERIEAMGRFFRNGNFQQEVLQIYASPDMIVLAMIEQQNVEVGGLPAQDWPLRVTLVYRRQGSEWRLAHRHADPLVQGISLEQAAALARGDQAGVTRG